LFKRRDLNYVPVNRYSLVKRLRVDKLNFRLFFLNKRRKKLNTVRFFKIKKSLIKKFGNQSDFPPLKGKTHRYPVRLKRSVFNVGDLGYSPNKSKSGSIKRNRFFLFRRQLGLKKKVFLKGKKKKKYSFIFLSFRKKKYKRRSSKSPSRKFFTNIWLIAFIFVKPISIKKLWYSRLITNRVLSFFCTNFW
jgi:hypothetical protein